MYNLKFLLLAALTTGTAASAQLLLQPSPLQLEAPLILDAGFDFGTMVLDDAAFSDIPVIVDNAYAAIGDVPFGGEIEPVSTFSLDLSLQWEFYSSGWGLQTGRSFGDVPELAGGVIGDFPDIVLDFTVSTNWFRGAVIDLFDVPPFGLSGEPFIFLGRAGGTVYAFGISVDNDFGLFPQNEGGFTSLELGEFGSTFAITDVFIVAPVPEPSLIALLAVGGLGGLIWFRRRAKR